MNSPSALKPIRFAVVACTMLVASACGSSSPDVVGDASDTTAVAAAGSDDGTASTSTTAAGSDDGTASTTTTAAGSDDETASTTTTAAGSDDETASTTTTATVASDDCGEVAALFVTRGSANDDLDDPEVAASCDGTDIVITSNGIPDFTYIGTSPGAPGAREHVFTIPATPTLADDVTAVPYIGVAAVTLSGIPIFGPTEGTGGDVDSLPGIVSACGSHNGPSGFHTHKILASSETDCFFTPEEVAEAPQLAGYALDGFPIYTGIDQYTSSWELTDESLFATDTWAAHTYVEGSGDLDECNGRTDADGNYAYYTTEGFPYVLGCFAGIVDLDSAGGGGGGGGGGAAGGDDADRPERPEGDAGAERPEPPEGEAGAERPERPDRPEPPEGEAGADRPEPPEGEPGVEPADEDS